MFRCSSCHTELEKKKSKHGLFWLCSSCKGRAVSLSILRRALDKKYVNQMWQKVFQDKGREGQDCPICRKAMLEVYKPEQNVFLDVCKRCQFVWFDPNEYEQAPAACEPKKVEENKLSPELEQAVAVLKVKHKPRQPSVVDEGLPDSLWKGLLGVVGFPVEENVEKPQKLSIATLLLSAIVITVSILSFSNLMDIATRYGLIPAEFTRAGGMTLITSFFIHGGILHLVGNMYFLLVFGDNVEDYLGAPRFLLMILFATLLGGFLHIALDPSSSTPCIGASGGISAVIVFYAMQFPHARLGVFVWYFVYIRWLNLSVRFALFIWIAMQILGAIQQAADLSNVSSMAHLGGAIVGFIFWYFYKDDPKENAKQKLKEFRETLKYRS